MAVREEKVTEENDTEEAKRLMLKIAAILDEARTSYATHNRKLKELSLLRSKSSSSSLFFSTFSRTLTPIFDFQRRLASVERVVSFVSALAASASDEFLDHFLKFLLAAATASNKTARFRACQIISEVTDSHNFRAIFNLLFCCILLNFIHISIFCNMKFYEISDCSDGFMKSDTEVKNAYNFKFYDYMEDESVQ